MHCTGMNYSADSASVRIGLRDVRVLLQLADFMKLYTGPEGKERNLNVPQMYHWNCSKLQQGMRVTK